MLTGVPGVPGRQLRLQHPGVLQPSCSSSRPPLRRGVPPCQIRARSDGQSGGVAGSRGDSSRNVQVSGLPARRTWRVYPGKCGGQGFRVPSAPRLLTCGSSAVHLLGWAFCPPGPHKVRTGRHGHATRRSSKPARSPWQAATCVRFARLRVPSLVTDSHGSRGLGARWPALHGRQSLAARGLVSLCSSKRVRPS